MTREITKQDLFLAILAMDSYHRGYGEQVFTLGRSTTQIGKANILNVDIPDGSRPAGFYASAYDVSGVSEITDPNKTVIAYRGTDYDATDGLSTLRDIWYGWGAGAGATGNPWGLGSQADLTIKYYESVVRLLDNNPARTIYNVGGAKPILTGHSLGGGLAGFASYLSGSTAVGFDHMPFGVAAIATLAVRVLDAIKTWNDDAAHADDQIPLTAIFTRDLLDKLQIHQPSFDVFKGISTAFEINAGLRNGLIAGLLGISLGVLASFIPLAGPLVGGLLAALGGSIAGGQVAAEANIDQTVLETYGWTNIRPDQRHSQALLTILTFADLAKRADSFSANWQTQRIANPGLWALFDDDLAKAAGANNANILGLAKNEQKYGTILQTALAYSALDEGEDNAKPFGDTGVKALIDDWSQLGYVINLSNHNAFFDTTVQFFDGFSNALAGIFTKDVTALMTRIATQYAGALALYDVEDSEAKQVLGDKGAKGGIVALSDDKTALALDLSSILWGNVLKAGGDTEGPERLQPVDEDKFRSAFFNQSAETSRSIIARILSGITGGSISSIDEEALKKLAAFWEASSASIFDRYHVATKANDDEITLSERTYKDKIPATKGDQVHVDVYIGTQGDDKVHGTSGNDLLILGAGDDIVYSRGGRDMVLGGSGNDEIVDQIGERFSSQDDGSDIYVGDTLDKSMVQGFFEYLRGLVGAGDKDTVRYSVEDPITKQLAAKGVEIISGEIVPYGTAKGIKLKVRDLNTGLVSSDILIDIDIVELSERADTLVVNDITSKIPVIVDLGSPKTGTVGKSAFDTVSFAARADGVVTINGSVGNNTGAGSVVDLTDSVALSLLRAFFTPKAELHFRGAENVILSNKDDVYFGGNLSNLLGVSQGFFGVPNHPGFGTISGGDGKDLLIYYGAGHKDAGELIDPAKPDGPRAAEELFLRLDGGAGKDDILIVGGDRGKAIGGLGRDWIYNRSMGGEIYGDSEDGFYEKPLFDADGAPVLKADGTQQTIPTEVEDNEANADNIWYSPNTIVMDAQHHDVLKFYGLTLTGGDASGGIAGLMAFGGIGAVVGMANFWFSIDETGKYNPSKSVYFDHLFPWMTYIFRPNEDGGQDMFITNQFDQLFTAVIGGTASDAYKAQQALDAQGILKGWMKVEDFDLVGSFIGEHQGELDDQGTFGMVFKASNPLADLMEMYAPIVGLIGRALAAKYGGMKLVDQALTLAAAAARYAVGMDWSKATDPLVIDLDGDGIETTEIATSQVYFDIDGDLFAERTGWLKGDDGFLVRDANGNGRIDNISEMFGGVGQSGFALLSELDSDGDGKITRADVLWSELKVWQDYNRDGITDAGELKTLDQLGIVTLDLGSTAINLRTLQGAHLTAFGDVTFEDGAVRRMYDAILNSNDTDTKFAGESGRADWQFASTLDVKGFGRITNLSVAMANDIVFDQLATTTAAAMTVPKLRTLVAQVGDILGAWGEALELTRELTPVLVGLDVDSNAVLLDRGVYVEDAQGGYWTLASGAPVRDAQGQPIARATLQDVLAQAAASGAAWRLEQTWSPSSREAALTDREAAPYLMSVVNGRAVILDYGIQQADGSWQLASDSATTYGTKADILALAHPTGTEWRTEELGFNPYANLTGRQNRRALHRRHRRRLHGEGHRPGRHLLCLGAQSRSRAAA